MNPRKDILRRVYFIYLLVFIFAVAIIGRVVYIQTVEGKQLIERAQENELRYFTQEAVRGNICASDGSPMAISVPIFDIRMDVASDLIHDTLFNKKVDSLALCLSKLFKDRSKYQYKKGLINARKDTNRYYLLKKRITYDELKKVKLFPILRRGKYKGGLIVIPGTKREMPFNKLACRTIGYENRYHDIYVGLEGAYSEVLQGINGKRLMRRVNNGNWIPVNDRNEIEPQNGKDVITCIDIDIQDVAEEALIQHLKEHGAHHGCAILMEVKTGKIKAIANLKYDSASKQYEELYNYAIGERIEPGSTFKLASFLALLEDKMITLTDTVHTGDGWTMYYGQTMRDVHKIDEGIITARDAFEKSSNVGVSKLVYKSYKNNPKKFTDHFSRIGLTNQHDIEIAGEAKPLFKNPESSNWYGTSLPWMSIGYESMLTPLQILTFYNAIANDGKMVKPIFVEAIRQAQNTIEVSEVEVLNEAVCSPQTVKLLQDLLEGVVERGTAQRLNQSVYKIAGKTGTAQIANKNRGYDKDNYNASFVGYFPADNPKYSCIVVVNRPTKGYYYGSSVAAPVFKEIADKVYATQLDIPMEKQEEEIHSAYPLYLAGNTKDLKKIIQTCGIPADTSEIKSEWAVIMPDNDGVKLANRLIKEGRMPNVTGMNASDAVFLLEKLGLKTKITGRGIVKSQSVEMGKPINKGDVIILKLSTT